MILRLVTLAMLFLTVQSESSPGTTPVMYSTSNYMGPCTWFEKINTNTRNGTGKPYNTIMECREACMREANSCKYGFDWDPQNDLYKCWFSTTNIVAYAERVSHFLFTCPGTTLFSGGEPIATTTGMDGGGGGEGGELVCTWQRWPDALTSNGTPKPADTLEECQKECLKMDKCQYGLDFNPNAAPGLRCFISNSRQLFFGNGVYHYLPECNAGGRTTRRTSSARISSEVSIIVTTVSMLLTALLLTFY